MKNERILILVPPSSTKGGIRNYYAVLKPLFSMNVTYLNRGGKNQPHRDPLIIRVYRNVSDFIHYIIELIRGVSLVNINISLSLASAIRDAFYLLVAKLLKKKHIIFFRGWDLDEARKIEKKHLWWFKRLFLGANAIITLTTESKETLQKWGYLREIYLETTVVDEKLLEYKDMRGGELLGDSGAFKVLFLARLQKAKGIYELIEAVGLLKKKGYNIKLIIAGSGLEESAIRREYKYDWIKMIGYVEGKEKARAYQCADIYVLPSYTEGMPNSVLEAMAFGLPVVCSNVGSLPEIIVEGVNGSIIESIDSEAIATAIERLYMDQDLRKSITENNIKESRRFCSSNVVKRLEVIYRKVISEN